MRAQERARAHARTNTADACTQRTHEHSTRSNRGKPGSAQDSGSSLGMAKRAQKHPKALRTRGAALEGGFRGFRVSVGSEGAAWKYQTRSRRAQADAQRVRAGVGVGVGVGVEVCMCKQVYTAPLNGSANRLR